MRILQGGRTEILIDPDGHGINLTAVGIQKNVPVSNKKEN